MIAFPKIRRAVLDAPPYHAGCNRNTPDRTPPK
jgi:hypothetical protein